MGTALEEHLPSIVERTSWRNGVSPGRAIRDVGFDALRTEAGRNLPGEVRRRWVEQLMNARSVALLGDGRVVATMIDALERLTRRRSVRRRTLLDWAAALGYRLRFRARRAFCWRCIARWRDAGEILYEPLLWQLEDVVVCPFDGTPLRTRCPNDECAVERWVLSANAIPGLCDTCGTGLWNDPGAEPSWGDEERAWYCWAARELGEAISATPSLDAPPSPEILSRAIMLAVARTAGSISRFAEVIGVAVSTVSVWKDGRRLPPLDAILRICRVAGFPVAAFLAGDLPALEAAAVPNKTPWLPPRQMSYQARDWRACRRALRDAATIGAPEAPTTIVRRHGIGARFARRRAPALWDAASRRARDARVAAASALALEREREVVQIIRTLDSEGLYPSLHRVRLRARRSIWNECLRVWRRELTALGYRPGTTSTERNVDR